jgi:hypothetical protein
LEAAKQPVLPIQRISRRIFWHLADQVLSWINV